MEAGNIDKDIFRTMLQTAYRRLLVAEPGMRSSNESRPTLLPRVVVRLVVEYRANQILPNPYPEKRTIDQWINRAAFGQPLDGQFGNMGVNNIIGPGSIRIDMGLTRAFKVYENHSIEVRGEAFHLPNHVNPNNPTIVLNNSLFGKITTVGDPRILQFALKYAF
jgi:hypothetical protein